MTKIFLIRHGETEWNASGKLQGSSNIRLSSAGIHQAQLLAAHAPFHEIDAIYSSDLIRAKMTADVLAAKFNLPVQVVPELRETGFGDWEGQDIKTLAQNLTDGFENFFVNPELCRPPHGETFADCQKRVVNAFRKIIAAHENQRVIVVSHGAAIRLYLCAILEMPIRKMWSLSQFNTALNILRVDDGSVTVEMLNGTFKM